MKNLKELEEFVNKHFPGASVECDDYGEYIIYTGLIIADEKGNLREVRNEDFEKRGEE